MRFSVLAQNQKGRTWLQLLQMVGDFHVCLHKSRPLRANRGMKRPSGYAETPPRSHRGTGSGSVSQGPAPPLLCHKRAFHSAEGGAGASWSARD
ncbi:hypothetical protein P4O66_018289 [Electrophorus voltai]|uniref:Uncharacterized protein n=1 Tax=Electrophorus voltai TaxID=2609070 RepID=A0AAD8YRZ4_9TELE|nr:hypothetical protein P4O66_018289 [Electrophorus voltai]